MKFKFEGLSSNISASSTAFQSEINEKELVSDRITSTLKQSKKKLGNEV